MVDVNQPTMYLGDTMNNKQGYKILLPICWLICFSVLAYNVFYNAFSDYYWHYYNNYLENDNETLWQHAFNSLKNYEGLIFLIIVFALSTFFIFVPNKRRLSIIAGSISSGIINAGIIYYFFINNDSFISTVFLGAAGYVLFVPFAAAVVLSCLTFKNRKTSTIILGATDLVGALLIYWSCVILQDDKINLSLLVCSQLLLMLALFNHALLNYEQHKGVPESNNPKPFLKFIALLLMIVISFSGTMLLAIKNSDYNEHTQAIQLEEQNTIREKTEEPINYNGYIGHYEQSKAIKDSIDDYTIIIDSFDYSTKDIILYGNIGNNDVVYSDEILQDFAKNKNKINSVTNENNHLLYENDTLYSDDKSKIYFYIGKGESFIIGNENIYLMPYALSGTNVRDVQIDPTTEHTLYEYSLDCPITSLTIPDNTTFVNECTLGKAESLREINLGNGEDFNGGALIELNEECFKHNKENNVALTVNAQQINQRISLPGNYNKYILNLSCSREEFVDKCSDMLDFLEIEIDNDTNNVVTLQNGDGENITVIFNFEVERK
ncbi:MAG: hypothetical protein ACI4IE_00635 [Eubacterium sp.]